MRTLIVVCSTLMLALVTAPANATLEPSDLVDVVVKDPCDATITGSRNHDSVTAASAAWNLLSQYVNTQGNDPLASLYLPQGDASTFGALALAMPCGGNPPPDDPDDPDDCVLSVGPNHLLTHLVCEGVDDCPTDQLTMKTIATEIVCDGGGGGTNCLDQLQSTSIANPIPSITFRFDCDDLPTGDCEELYKRAGSASFRRPDAIVLEVKCDVPDVPDCDTFSRFASLSTKAKLIDLCDPELPDCLPLGTPILSSTIIPTCKTPDCGGGTTGAITYSTAVDQMLCRPCPAQEVGDILQGDVIDRDCDDVPDGRDNCPDKKNPYQEDYPDDDGYGNACDPDDDNDGDLDGDDNCPDADNQDQADLDNDGKGDACDDIADSDNDGRADGVDNCPYESNSNQMDHDGDGIGTACDPDDDNDTIMDGPDNCDFTPNTTQTDMDQDGEGDACDGQSDADGDGKWDSNDNCPTWFNPDQSDLDGDGTGDACDADRDGDGIPQSGDNCDDNWNPGQGDMDGDQTGDSCDTDRDGDGVPDDEDNCDTAHNPNQNDLNNDGTGDMCQDADGDGVGDWADNCPGTYNPDQANSDTTPAGDACTGDDPDGDGDRGNADNCLNDSNPNQQDRDFDGQGDACDTDDDGDGIPDNTDNCDQTWGSGSPCPANSDTDNVPDDMDNCDHVWNEDQFDSDGDAPNGGGGDACDPDNRDGPTGDKDSDAIPNNSDNCPDNYNPGAPQPDSDGDGIGDACDP